MQGACSLPRVRGEEPRAGPGGSPGRAGPGGSPGRAGPDGSPGRQPGRGRIELAKKNTVAEVTELVEPIVEGLGLTLWDVRYVKEGALWYLRIYIDKDEGVTIEDCETVTRAIDAPLDELDPIEGNYILEVSSPGIERELLLDRHFDRFIGAPVMIKLIRPDGSGNRDIKGTLIAHDKETVEIMSEQGEETVIKKKDTVYIKLDDFNI